MTPEDRSKIQSFISDLQGLKSRDPQESKFKDCREKIEKKLEEVFGGAGAVHLRLRFHLSEYILMVGKVIIRLQANRQQGGARSEVGP